MQPFEPPKVNGLMRAENADSEKCNSIRLCIFAFLGVSLPTRASLSDRRWGSSSKAEVHRRRWLAPLCKQKSPTETTLDPMDHKNNFAHFHLSAFLRPRTSHHPATVFFKVFDKLKFINCGPRLPLGRTTPHTMVAPSAPATLPAGMQRF